MKLIGDGVCGCMHAYNYVCMCVYVQHSAYTLKLM